MCCVISTWLPLTMSVVQWDSFDRKEEAMKNKLGSICLMPNCKFMCIASAENKDDASKGKRRILPHWLPLGEM